MCLSACSTIHLFDVWFFLKEHKEKDREKGAIHAWLEDHVVTDTVYVATEDIVWEALWDQARKLKKREIVSFFFTSSIVYSDGPKNTTPTLLLISRYLTSS